MTALCYLVDGHALLRRRLVVLPDKVWVHVARYEHLPVLARQKIAELPVLVAVERLDQKR